MNELGGDKNLFSPFPLVQSLLWYLVLSRLFPPFLPCTSCYRLFLVYKKKKKIAPVAYVSSPLLLIPPPFPHIQKHRRKRKHSKPLTLPFLFPFFLFSHPPILFSSLLPLHLVQLVIKHHEKSTTAFTGLQHTAHETLLLKRLPAV